MNTKKVKVKCETKGILMENDYPINLLDPSNVDKMQSYLEKQLKLNLEHLIAKTQQRVWIYDILGVGSKIHQRDPKTWSQLEVYWEQIYPTLDFEVEAKDEGYFYISGAIANSEERKEVIMKTSRISLHQMFTLLVLFLSSTATLTSIGRYSGQIFGLCF